MEHGLRSAPAACHRSHAGKLRRGHYVRHRGAWQSRPLCRSAAERDRGSATGIDGGIRQELRQHYRDSLYLERTATQVFYGLGLLALVLTATGLHGITGALFARRSKEFAIRLALGAAPRQIVGTVLASGLKLTAAGLAAGLTVAIPGGLFLSSRMHGVPSWSVAALGLSSAIVGIAALAAAAQPASRVLRIQPGDIVRSE